MLHSLDHVVIAVRNLSEATDLYTELLGVAPSWRGRHPQADTANTLFGLANCYLELLASTGDEGVGGQIEQLLAERGEGLAAVCFGADDAAAFAAGMRARGIDATDPQPGEGHSDPADAVRRWTTVHLPPKFTRGLPLFAIEHDPTGESLPLARPAAAPEGAVRALDHVVVSSRDLDASAEIYGEALGLRLALDRRFDARGLRILFYRVGGVTVEVVGALEPGGDASEADRFGGLAYQVADIDLARRRLLTADFDVSDLRDGHKPGTRICSVRNHTCGVPTLLIEPATGSRG